MRQLIKFLPLLVLSSLIFILFPSISSAQTATSTATATPTPTPTPTSTPNPQQVYRKFYRDNGTATTSNYRVEFPFNPLTFTICDEEASGGIVIYYNFVTGLAVSTNKSTSGRLLAGTCQSFSLEDNDVYRTFYVGVISASSTAAFNVYGAR